MIGDNSILLSLSEDQRPAIMSLQRRKLGRSPLPLALTQTDSGRKLEKLSSVDPKVSHSHYGSVFENNKLCCMVLQT